MFRLGREKRGLSDIVAYVLLISITISLSVVVYGWLKFYVGGTTAAACPDGVNLIIESYSCSGRILDVTLKNKGRFDVDGYVLRVNDREDAEFGLYAFDEVGTTLGPGESVSASYDFDDYTFKYIEEVTLVDVQPYLNESGKISCEAYASQKVICN